MSKKTSDRWLPRVHIADSVHNVDLLFCYAGGQSVHFHCLISVHKDKEVKYIALSQTCKHSEMVSSSYLVRCEKGHQTYTQVPLEPLPTDTTCKHTTC